MNNKVSARPPTRPNIPRPPSFRSNSMAAFTSPRKSATSSRLSKYEQYLYPQTFETLSSAAPLAANIIYPIETPYEEEEELEPTISIYEKFERQRKKILSKYTNPSDPTVIVVSLKSDRLKISRPSISQNETYYQLTKPPKENDIYSNKEEDDESDSQPQPIITVDIHEDDPEVIQAYADELIEYDLNEAWFDSILLDLDDVYPEFLNNLPGTEENDKSFNSGKGESRGESVSSTKEDESYLMFEDPIQSAFSAALKKQRANATYVEEEEAPKTQQPNIHRTLSAAELNRQWGFKDPEIGKYIAKFRKQFEDGGKKK
ncbi:hypothetical protein TRFO_05194 [Tritrichomonas foetus]|uniref:Uncharacterized protein n=1 Tax=Tritrichomonas foetus TaxID=1144522 RepID=A0A1J4K832_9EUKA|nr:hypothetical protein TRFO_05194 [Tritrichomonas foetus]|eukprot:OHT07559.1 hypothetical protein TRFO_05194 [Tritrichomonas foetus]